MTPRRTAKDAPPVPAYFEKVARWLETHVRRPLEGTWFDVWVATPAKEYYIQAKRRH